ARHAFRPCGFQSAVSAGPAAQRPRPRVALAGRRRTLRRGLGRAPQAARRGSGGAVALRRRPGLSRAGTSARFCHRGARGAPLRQRAVGSLQARAVGPAGSAMTEPRSGRACGTAAPVTTQRAKVVLYNPRAVFFTMPLALLAIGSELDPELYEV